MKKFLTLNIKKFFLTIVAFIVFVVLHNVFYAIFGFEEPVFFLLAVIGVPLYLASGVIVTIIGLIRKNR